MNTPHPLLPLLQCPQCGAALVFTTGREEMSCESCSATFPLVNGLPVLLRQDNSLFHPQDYRQAQPAIKRDTCLGPANLIPSPSVNLARTRVLGQVKDLLQKRRNPTVLVIGGGQQRQWLDARLNANVPIRIIYTDIDIHADVDLFCDAHDLPFRDEIFDAVVTTAVLEHVLDPGSVAAGIHRVLKTDGLLYSELPFMQQVHEGAYDFTRYTLSGHRRLFHHFAELDSGMIAGPATALVWSIENFLLAFVRKPAVRTTVKASVRTAFAWIKLFDHLLQGRPEAMDGASCTYFLGRRAEKFTPDTDIIARYVGAKHMRHS